MTVTASPADVPAGTPPGVPQNTLGKGQQVLSDIAAVQALVTAAANPAVQPALVARLNQLQIEAVDYFMGSYWVAADQILAVMTADMILPRAGDAFVTAQLAKIATRATQVAALVAAIFTMHGTPPGGVDEADQYSVGYPAPNSGYPLTEPDVYLYMLQTQLVDYCMNRGILPATTILATMTGVQTYPWNGYQSDYTWYQQYWDGVY